MGQIQIQQTPRRPRGRPPIRSDEDTRNLLIEAAAREFRLNGYAGANICAVAQLAGVSTKTLYRLVPTKADLFEGVVTDCAKRFILAIDDEVIGKLDTRAALEQILFAFGSLTLSDEVIAMNRLVIGECERFPEIARTFYESAVTPINAVIEAWLRRESEAGRIRLDDIHAASGMLRGMMSLEPQRTAMMGQRTAPDQDEIAARAKQCAELFFNGCKA